MCFNVYENILITKKQFYIEANFNKEQTNKDYHVSLWIGSAVGNRWKENRVKTSHAKPRRERKGQRSLYTFLWSCHSMHQILVQAPIGLITNCWQVWLISRFRRRDPTRRVMKSYWQWNGKLPRLIASQNRNAVDFNHEGSGTDRHWHYLKHLTSF